MFFLLNNVENLKENNGILVSNKKNGLLSVKEREKQK
jgi:hypothetical protein